VKTSLNEIFFDDPEGNNIKMYLAERDYENISAFK
jgi:catechol-2,3-dioxygenase